MPNSFHNINNPFDPNNPTDALIIAQRAIYSDWQDQVAVFAPTDVLETSDWDIHPVPIYESYHLSKADVAALRPLSPLAHSVQQHLIAVYQRRGLHFPPEQVYAIANPDETDRSDQRAAYQGVMIFLDSGYDFRVPVTLTKGFDGEQFDFFFALRLLKVPRMELDHFLHHQMKENFEGNPSVFRRFLDLLLSYISDELTNLEHQGERYVLSPGLRLNVAGWTADASPLEEESDTEGTTPPSDQGEPIQDDINLAHFRRALNGLKSIKNKFGRPVISDEDLAYLKEQGPFILLGNTHRKVPLDLGRMDKTKIYGFLYWLWNKFSDAKNRGKDRYAQYLACYFQDFSGLKPLSLIKSINPASLADKERFNEAYKNSKD